MSKLFYSLHLKLNYISEMSRDSPEICFSFMPWLNFHLSSQPSGTLKPSNSGRLKRPFHARGFLFKQRPVYVNTRYLKFFKPRIKNVINRFEFLVILYFDIFKDFTWKFFSKLCFPLYSIGNGFSVLFFTSFNFLIFFG